jgi:hypothetical protein
MGAPYIYDISRLRVNRLIVRIQQSGPYRNVNRDVT